MTENQQNNLSDLVKAQREEIEDLRAQLQVKTELLDLERKRSFPRFMSRRNA